MARKPTRIALALVALAHGTALAYPTLSGVMAHSRDDIPAGFASLTGDDATANVTLPFAVVIEGVHYTALTISTNGWLEFGGNTQGTSDPTNACLPTSKHTHPFLAYYWDDMRTINTAIQYGTVGTAPGRVFIVDADMERTAGANHDVTLQVQIHEGSNLVTVKYQDTEAESSGQTATIGFQGAGGSSATARPLVCNGKILDDNTPLDAWSIDLGLPTGTALAGFMVSSRDDIPGTFTTLSGNDATANATLPFNVTIDGTSYSSVTISTNGWLEFGGNTQGTSDPTNACLPTSKHTNPFLAAYWDDMRTINDAIRYGTVGTSPNRTFIVDVNVENNDTNNNDITYQVHIHERSNTITIKYVSSENEANGQHATIGFQHAGGATAIAEPITCNGKVLDDNSNDTGWSIDLGSPNGSAVQGVIDSSRDDLPASFTTLSGNDSLATANLGFTLHLDGVGYTTVAISTNGWMEFGGNTRFGSDPTNVCLPTAFHTHHFLAAYWDDLRTIGSNIRYGTVGSSPNRTFIADFELENNFGSNHNITMQVQVHERSNLITVAYLGTEDQANGQTATIGYQSAGGSGARVRSITCNGKVLDDNTSRIEGWSVSQTEVCGDELTGSHEACDLGSANGAFASCCTTGCTFRTAGSTCRSSAGVCDVAESCTGTSATCPTDGFASSTTVCRPAAGVCDVDETCTGTGAACPANAFAPSGTVCRPAADVCDLAETCPGTSASCPADAFASAATVCRAAAGACDVAEHCTGLGTSCPADAKSTAVCRPGAGACDVAETCDGTSNDCPPDLRVPAGTTCRAAAGVCDVPETCDGVNAACPPNAFEPAGSMCRPANGVCDVAESCSGTSAACPPDGFQPATTVCRPDVGPCDVAEHCTGHGPSCPPDSVAGAFLECRPAAGPCDVAESCDGVNKTCPADVKSTATCRPANGVCDVAESCDGTSNDCPADVKSTATCRPANGACDVAESCDGTSNDCPADGLAPATTECRAAADLCDVAELCTGVSAACPPDLRAPDGVPCDDGSVCTTADTCEGGVCVGTPLPTGCADHFLCYQAKSARFTPVSGVHLVDDFEDVTADVVKPKTLCPPANKNGEGIFDDTIHLESYLIRQSPRHVRRGHVEVDDQFGQLFVDTVKADLLLVPTAASTAESPSPPDPQSHDVDHYKCYRIKVTSGTPRFQKGVQALVADEFTSPAKRFDVKKPRHLCNPVDKNGEGLNHPDVRLLCYQVKPAKGEPRAQGHTLFVNNQFGPGAMYTIRERELCVPSVKPSP